MNALLARYQVLLYFAVTFAISWGTVLMAVGPSGFPGTDAAFADRLTIVVAAMLLGPSIAGIAMTGLVNGKGGLSAYFRRFRTPIPARRYIYALWLAPATVVAVLLLLSTASSAYTPGVVKASDPVMHVLLGLITGVCAGFFEELGWTGFAVPVLRKRFSALMTGLIVGVVWGAWHLLVVWWGSAPSGGGLSMWFYLPALCFSFLPPYRVLMVRLYDRTPSLPLAMLMHAALTASVRIFDPIGISGATVVTYQLTFGAALWLVVGALSLRDRNAHSQEQMRRRLVSPYRE